MPPSKYTLTNGHIAHIRFASSEEAPLAVEFMQKLGEFQKMRDAVLITSDQMADLIQNGHGEVIFVEYTGEIKAFAFVCKHASAFIGRCVLYIDAFYVDEALRGHGIGKVLMQFLSQLCVERNYGRMEWCCLDWNTKAWDFYVNLGSKSMDSMTLHRLDEPSLKALGTIPRT